MTDTLELDGASLTPEALAAAAHGYPHITLSADGRSRMAASRAFLDQEIAANRPIYGVTRGLGARAGETLSAAQIHDFSLQTIRGRAHAVGPLAAPALVRAVMIVRLNTLLRGHAAASRDVAELLLACLNLGLTPVTRSLGSVGAADLVCNASLALALIGEGQIEDRHGNAGPALQLLSANGLAPLVLAPRDGLALISNSCTVAAHSALALVSARRAFEAAQTAAALSLESFLASLSPFEEQVLAVKPQHGQDKAAEGIRRRLEGSHLADPSTARRLQDPVSFRNIPQIHGTVAAALDFARQAVNAEINGSSDNPVCLAEAGRVMSCGAYFTSELANAVETLNRSFVHLSFGQIARLSKLLNPEFSGLPLFLADAASGSNGFAPLMKVAESVGGEIAHMAQAVAIWPSINANGVEDCLSSAPAAVRALDGISQMSPRLTAIELMVAARGIELRDIDDRLGLPMRKALGGIRARSSSAIDNRPLGDDVEALANEIRSGGFG